MDDARVSGKVPTMMKRVVVGLMAMTTAAIPASAQSPEVRADAIFAGPAAVHAGIGLIATVGTYLRSGIIGGIGAGTDGISGRVDIVNRFHLDPFREHKWAPYAGGGLTARFDDNRRARFYLLAVAGVDGPVRKGLTTAIEAGLGGGGRLGVIVRKAAAERR